MTEREKMLAGQLYDCGDKELLERWHKAKDLTREYNSIASEDLEPVQNLRVCGWRRQFFRQMTPKPQAILCVLTRILAKYGGKDASQTCVERFVSRL